jgi:hypothetical protein
MLRTRVDVVNVQSMRPKRVVDALCKVSLHNIAPSIGCGESKK